MESFRIENTINFIEENYYKPISVSDLESISCCSYRNLQRIIKYSYGETIGSFQIRLKLESAYKLILFSKESFSEIAYKVGFETLSAFSKAFKKRYKMTPKQARQKKEIIIKESEIKFGLSTVQLTPEIVYLTETKIFYQSTRTNYVNKEIEALWEKFSLNEFPKNSVDYFGVIADEQLITEQIKCRYDACFTVQPMNKKFPSKTIFGRKYAKFIHHGDYNSIEDTYSAIYTGWILTTRLEFGNSPIIEHYVRHSTNEASEIDYMTEILIPLN